MSECPDRAEIERLVSGRLTLDRSEHLERHIGGCRDCRRVLDDLFGAGTLLPPGPVPKCQRHPLSDALKRVMEELRSAPLPSASSCPRDPVDAPTRVPVTFLQPTEQAGFLGRLGPYEIRREIGRGGMGVVFEALDPTLKRTVAIKVLSPLTAADDDARGRFLREAQAAAALEHEHIVTIHAVDQVQGMPFLVMQYVDGESLAERLGRERRLPFEDVRRIGAQLARGLASAHAKGLIHRDIKPANILLDAATGRAKIVDFGLAKAAGQGSLTIAGTIVGTPEFMSPEQAGGAADRGVDARSDLFSLGVVLYVMCSGVSPFRADSPLLTLDRVRRDPVAPLTEIDPTLPKWFVALVTRLLMKDPADRFASAGEVAAILEGTSGAAPTLAVLEASSPTLALAPPARRSRRLRVVAALTGLLGVAIAAVIYANHNWPEMEQAAPQPGANEQPGPKAGEPNPAPRIGFLIAGKDQTYRTLAEAAVAARGGDTIEIHGNGPFPTSSVRLGGKSLTIRAAPGSRPVLVSASPHEPENGPLLRSDADLHLEGIEIRWAIAAPKGTAEEVMMAHCAVVHTRGRLTLAQCRFSPGRGNGAVGASGRELAVMNCHFAASDAFGILLRPEPDGRVSIEGSQFNSLIAIMFYTPAELPLSSPTAATVHLRHNTFSTGEAIRMLLNFQRKQPLKIAASRNIFDSDHLIMLMGPLGKKGDKQADAPRPEIMRGFLRSFVEWADDTNLYRHGCKYLVTSLAIKSPIHSAQVDGPAGWAGFWSQESPQSIEGVIHFRERHKSATERSFQLDRVEEATGAVPDKLGADPTRVGPR